MNYNHVNLHELQSILLDLKPHIVNIIHTSDRSTINDLLLHTFLQNKIDKDFAFQLFTKHENIIDIIIDIIYFNINNILDINI